MCMCVVYSYGYLIYNTLRTLIMWMDITISSHGKICKKNTVNMMLKQGRQFAWGMQNLSYIHISEGILCGVHKIFPI